MTALRRSYMPDIFAVGLPAFIFIAAFRCCFTIGTAAFADMRNGA